MKRCEDGWKAWGEQRRDEESGASEQMELPAIKETFAARLDGPDDRESGAKEPRTLLIQPILISSNSLTISDVPTDENPALEQIVRCL